MYACVKFCIFLKESRYINKYFLLSVNKPKLNFHFNAQFRNIINFLNVLLPSPCKNSVCPQRSFSRAIFQVRRMSLNFHKIILLALLLRKM